MKNALQIFALVSVLLACSDFFPEKVIERNNPGVQGGPSLPEKAVLDEKACDYGEVEKTDLTQGFVWNMTTKSICPKVREFRYYVTLLRLAARQLCLDKENTRVERDLEHLWFGTIASFGYLIANPMEPLRANSGKLGMEIYAWPNDNRYALNAELIKAANQGATYSMHLAPSRKGLSAVEKLIFNKEAVLTPGLSGQLRPDEVSFNALSRADRRAARCEVLSEMLNDVGVQTETLYQEWAADQKQYPRTLLSRLQAGAKPMILNEISDGLFYLEKVKDFKLGLPLGQNARCRSDRCPDEIESVLSGASVEALRANFDAFRAGMIGDHGPGFLDLVREVGRKDLAQLMNQMVLDMEQSLNAVEQGGSLRDQVLAMDKSQCNDVNSPIPVCRLFFQWKSFSTVYRTDFMTALNLQPPRTEADND